MSFEIQKSEQDNKPLLKFKGGIDEEAQFPTIEGLSGEVFVDLKDVSAINSIGIRAWIRWFSSMSSVQFNFINCPKALVMQMNMVEGFLPASSKVSSLEVPFYCEESDEEKDVMFEVGKEIIIDGDQVKLQFDKSNICGGDCEPELDVNEAKYFRFLVQMTGHKAA